VCARAGGANTLSFSYFAVAPLPPFCFAKIQNRKIFPHFFDFARADFFFKMKGKLFGCGSEISSKFQGGSGAERKLFSKVFLEKSSSFGV
jgi:hypothetical protein